MTAPVHALTPNMWFACGGTFVKNCGCGCAADYRPGRWVLRRKSTEGVTCPDCIDALEARAAKPAPVHQSLIPSEQEGLFT